MENTGLVRQMIEDLQKQMCLSDWIINIKYSEVPDEDKRCEASIEEDLRYLEADLTIYPAFWLNTQDHQRINLAHELTHLLLSPLHPYIPTAGDDILEGVVQKVAMTFISIMDHS